MNCRMHLYESRALQLENRVVFLAFICTQTLPAHAIRYAFLYLYIFKQMLIRIILALSLSPYRQPVLMWATVWILTALWRQERKLLQVPNNSRLIHLEETNTVVCLTHPNDPSVRDSPKNIPVAPKEKDNSVVTPVKQSCTIHMKDYHYNPSMTRLLSRRDYMSYHQLATVPCHVTGLLYANMLAARVCGHWAFKNSDFRFKAGNLTGKHSFWDVA